MNALLVNRREAEYFCAGGWTLCRALRWLAKFDFARTSLFLCGFVACAGRSRAFERGDLEIAQTTGRTKVFLPVGAS